MKESTTKEITQMRRKVLIKVFKTRGKLKRIGMMKNNIKINIDYIIFHIIKNLLLGVKI